MMAAKPSLIALRPFLPADTPILAAIFRASIEELTSEDYDLDQQEAWASLADDEEAFGNRLGAMLTLIATLSGSPVGFACLKGKDVIDCLYVHPVAVRQGAATALCDALEKLAEGRGASSMSVDASDPARSFFDRRGYQPHRRNTVSVGDEWLGNTTMRKTLNQHQQAQQ